MCFYTPRLRGTERAVYRSLCAPFTHQQTGFNTGISLPCTKRQTGKMGVHFLHSEQSFSPCPFPFLFLFFGVFWDANLALPSFCPRILYLVFLVVNRVVVQWLDATRTHSTYVGGYTWITAVHASPLCCTGVVWSLSFARHPRHACTPTLWDSGTTLVVVELPGNLSTSMPHARTHTFGCVPTF